jgi:glycosyltransferase involved in cell wall biosynthesis
MNAESVHNTDKSEKALPFISVIIPVLNGEGRLENCLASLQRQTYPKERFEIIVADGRSTDRTVEIAREYGAKVVDNPGRIVATGRNAGIQVAQGELLAFTDDDCILPSDWLAKAEQYLRDDSVGGVGGPTLLPDSATDFSKAVLTLFRWASLVGYSVQSDLLLTSDARDLPGCNVVYQARAIEQAGSYRKELITAEDVDMNLRVIGIGYRLVYAPDLMVWHNKRDEPLRLFHQIRRFAIGRVQLGRFHKNALRPLHLIAAVFTPCALVVLVTSVGSGLTIQSAVALMTALLSLASMAYYSSGSGKITFLMIPVTIIFLVAWSVGLFSQLLSPRPKKQPIQRSCL